MGSPRDSEGQQGEGWKRTLFAVFVSQMVATLSFNFINPFLPLFIVEDLGVSDPGQAAFWTGITQAAGSLSSFVTGPLWGGGGGGGGGGG